MRSAACALPSPAVSQTIRVRRDDARKYYRCVHRADRDGRCFTVWAERPPEGEKGRWTQYGYLWLAMLTHLRKISLERPRNLYMSVQSFCAPFRRAETLFRLNAIAYDIDMHECDGSAAAAADEALRGLGRDVFDTGVLPAPSMVIFTGRGLQVLYLLETLPRQGVPLWRLVGEAMAGRIRSCLEAHAGAVLDHNYGDIARVMRVPGTYNTAARCYASILAPEPGAEPVYYRLDALRDRYLPELVIDPAAQRERKKPPKTRPNQLARIFNTYTLHWTRLQDILLLVELRQAQNLSEDCRRRLVFLYRYWSCFCVGEDSAEEAALSFNHKFRTPLPESVVRGDTRSAEKAYRSWKDDHKNGYNYKNETLIQFLGITSEEQQRMQTIIGRDEKLRRMKARNWDHARRDEQRAKNTAQRDDEIVRLLRDGLSQWAIVERTGVSRNTISKIAKEHGIRRVHGQRTDLGR